MPRSVPGSIGGANGAHKPYRLRPDWGKAQAFEAPADRQQAEVLRQYIMQMRQELASRLLNRVYADETGAPSKWWLSYTKRKFMGKAL